MNGFPTRCTDDPIAYMTEMPDRSQRPLMICALGIATRLSQRMQISDHLCNLLRGHGVSHGRHHPSAMQNGFLHEMIIGEQTAGQVLLLVESHHAGSLKGLGRIGAMANGAIDLEPAPPACLL